MNNDIIIIILDIFKDRKDSESIFNCYQLNHQWHNIIYYYRDKYLKTPDMLLYQLGINSDYFNNQIKQFILSLDLHDVLNENIELNNNIVKNLIKYIPNAINKYEISDMAKNKIDYFINNTLHHYRINRDNILSVLDYIVLSLFNNIQDQDCRILYSCKNSMYYPHNYYCIIIYNLSWIIILNNTDYYTIDYIYNVL